MKRRFAHRQSDSLDGPGEAGAAPSIGSSAVSALTGSAPVPATPQQIRSVVKRLEVLLGEAIEQGRRVGVDVTPPKLARLCDELLREAREPGYRPENDGSVEAFFFAGIFEDLVQQPSNIFEQVSAPDGKEYYVPLTLETWEACLQALKFLLSPSQ